MAGGGRIAQETKKTLDHEARYHTGPGEGSRREDHMGHQALNHVSVSFAKDEVRLFVRRSRQKHKIRTLEKMFMARGMI